MYVKTRVKAVFFDCANENNNIYVFYRDDNGGFIKDTILRVRACCIDEIALAFNALTNRVSTLAASGQHHIKFVACYNSKNLKNKTYFVEYCIVDFYIKKASIQSVFFVKLKGINLLVQTSKVPLKLNMIKLVCLFLFSNICIFTPIRYVIIVACTALPTLI